jgi:SAM-dependent methyltransferase
MRAWIVMPIDAKKDEPMAFGNIMRCEDCGLGRTATMPGPDEVLGFYDLAAYYTHGQSHMQPVAPKLIDRVLVRLAWQADRARPFDAKALARALPPGGTVLDIGCGDGEKLEEFRDLGFAVMGVDPDPGSRAFAGSKDLTVLEGTAEAPPEELSGQQFDLVIMSHALEHCIDPASALATIHCLTKPDGVAYLEVPNAGCHHFELLRQCSEMFDAPRHLWFFTPEALQTLATKAGFSIDQWHYNGFTRLFTPTWRGWEREIFDRLHKRGLATGAVRHSRLTAFRLLARSAFAPALRKYDSIGILASRATASREQRSLLEMQSVA